MPQNAWDRWKDEFMKLSRTLSVPALRSDLLLPVIHTLEWNVPENWSEKLLDRALPPRNSNRKSEAVLGVTPIALNDDGVSWPTLGRVKPPYCHLLETFSFGSQVIGRVSCQTTYLRITDSAPSKRGSAHQFHFPF
jgi:hypothetical protein